MQTVTCLLPATRFRGRQVRWELPVEAAVALHCWHQADVPDRPSRIDPGLLIAAYPSLLVWCLCRHTPGQQLDHPLQLVTLLPHLFDCPAADDLNTPVTEIRPAAEAVAKYHRSLQKLADPERGPRDRKVRGKRVSRNVRRLIAEATGESRKRTARWLATRCITRQFWPGLAELSAKGNACQIGFADLRVAGALPAGSGGDEKSGPEKSGPDAPAPAERLASMRELAYGASHEINNPLANIASRAQTLLQDEVDPGRRQTLNKINQQAFRAHEMIADMMLFAHPPQPDRQPANPAEIARSVVQEMQLAATEQSTVLELRSAELPAVSVDRDQVAEALQAIVRNALESLGHGGQIGLEVARVGQDGHHWVEFRVSDDGPGFEAERIQHVFDPFFSGREAGRGLGFGLSKAWRIADLHDGEILAENPADGGARVRIRIPYRGTAA